MGGGLASAWTLGSLSINGLMSDNGEERDNGYNLVRTVRQMNRLPRGVV